MPGSADGADVDLGDVAMGAPRAIEGRVVDDAGGAVAAEVNIDGPLAPGASRWSHDFYGLTESRRTDDLGRFRFPDLAPGRYIVVVHRSGEPEDEREVLLPADRDVVDLVITRPAVRSVVLHVRDDLGRPLAGAIVSAGGRTEGRMTDANGDVTFSLEMHAVEVRAFVPDEGNRHFIPMSPFTVPAGAAEATIVLHEGVMLRGRVLAPDGKPLAQATVTVRREGVPQTMMNTNADGVFEATLSPGPVVSVEFAGMVAGKEAPFAGRIEGAAPGGDDVVLHLERLVADRVLRVRVTTPDGEPIPGAKLSVHTVGSSAFPRFLDADEHGMVEVTGLTARAVTIAAAPGPLPGGGSWYSPRPVEVVPDGTVVVFAMRRALPIRGRLVGADGKPARGTVNAYRATEYYVGVGTDAEGRFEIPLPAEEKGPWRLFAQFLGASPGADTAEAKDVASGAEDVRITAPGK